MTLDQQPGLLKRRRTKIVATVGPATREPAIMRQLVEAGVDVFRINMAHGDHDGHAEAFAAIRAAAAAVGLPVAVLADLAGPKIRVGNFAGGAVELVEGSVVTLQPAGEPDRPSAIAIGYPALCQDVEPGHRLFLDDGSFELVVEEVSSNEVTCRVANGGRLTDRKGVNFPDSDLSVTAPTDKDRIDASFAVDLGVDFLGLSFVRSPDDVRALSRHVGGAVPIIAKIEKPEALRCAGEILDVAGAIMVARGDLGVEVPLEAVPAAQDELVDLARVRDKPVIIATQMLDSMIRSPRPTRAEVSDVAHAVRSGADAVMLSGETAVGEHPVAAVETMNRVVRRTEAGQWAESAFHSLTRDDWGDRAAPEPRDAMSRAVSQLSRDLRVRAILVISRSGMSARIVSSSRPAAPLLGASDDERTCRRMNLLWGVVPTLVTPGDMDDVVSLFRRLVTELGLAGPGDLGLVVRGFRDHTPTNLPSATVVSV